MNGGITLGGKDYLVLSNGLVIRREGDLDQEGGLILTTVGIDLDRVDPEHNALAQDRALGVLAGSHRDLRVQVEAILAALRSELAAFLSNGGYMPRWERYPLAAGYYVRKREQ